MEELAKQYPNEICGAIAFILFVGSYIITHVGPIKTMRSNWKYMDGLERETRAEKDLIKSYLGGNLPDSTARTIADDVARNYERKHAKH